MKTLIAYFSWSNHTKELAERIAKEKGYDLLCIKRKVPYSSNYHTCAYVEAKEEVEKKVLPEISPIPVDIGDYQRILLFFPIWWYTIPMPVGSFASMIREYPGEVMVFANSYTNDPQYMINALRGLRKIAPGVNFQEGLFNRSFREHTEFLK